MRVFENPSNGYKEEVSNLTMLWTFLFGGLYLAVRGVWTHVLVFVVLVILSLVIFPPALVFVWVIYALVAPSIIATRYLRRGWREVKPAG